ncbi:DUF3088 domain-containing protein [Roseibium sediminis]|uniref:DUF3088 domain-containing protein n=1 Tax=Roseibium sediminis TaxID=1775174 RepID=UPI00123DFD53|nr:DUF3088 domain-containing protein [Roseibium sediminis]
MTDTLYILDNTFADPAHGGKVFYCEHCIIMEGLLAAYPQLAEKLTVRRIDWPRPRKEIVELLGEENQNLPVLVLAEGGFINTKDDILKALSERHGIPLPHP